MLCLLAAAAGCTRDSSSEAPSTSLLSEVKTALAEREQRLTSYHLVADSTQAGELAHHEFFYRSPNHSRGVATGAGETVSVAFDGTTLWRLEPAEKKVLAYTLQLPPQQAAFVLASLFRPFAPDGFRTPLLPSKGVTATQVNHPMGPKAVELAVLTQDDDGPVETTYVVRYPSGDFLGRRTRSGTHLSEVKVELERCEAALKLCLPMKLTETRDGAVVGTTTLTLVELNPDLPVETFRVEPPEGYTVQQRVMKPQ